MLVLRCTFRTVVIRDLPCSSYCRGEPGGSLSGGYAPDSAKAEGSSIVDEPGEG